jgi:hypothetical protein
MQHSERRKYAVQRPKGKKWETLSLVDSLAQGKQEFKTAVSLHGIAPIRLIQLDFVSDEALSDFDWRLIELHTPDKAARGRPSLQLVAGTVRKDGEGKATKDKGTETSKRKGDRLAAGDTTGWPVKWYLIAFMVGAIIMGLWRFYSS